MKQDTMKNLQSCFSSSILNLRRVLILLCLLTFSGILYWLCFNTFYLQLHKKFSPMYVHTFNFPIINNTESITANISEINRKNLDLVTTHKTSVQNTTTVHNDPKPTMQLKLETNQSVSCSPDLFHSIPLKSSTNIPEKFLRLSDEHVLAPPCGYGDLLKPWLYGTDSNYDMVFLVKESPFNIKKRQLLRSTYGKIRSLNGMNFATIFVVARPPKPKQQQLLEEENKVFGDMLQCDFLDSYKNLAVKVFSMFRWVSEDNLNSTRYTFIDDDCIINLKNVESVFFHLKYEKAIHCGHRRGVKEKPRRATNSKWYISNEQYPNNFYPTFCAGGMYTISQDLIKDLYCMAQRTERGSFYLEDVYFTGIVREKLGKNNSIYPPGEPVAKCFHFHAPGEQENKIQTTWEEFMPEVNRNDSDKSGKPLITFFKRNINKAGVDSIIKQSSNGK